MVFSFDVNKKVNGDFREEGWLRETLAAYFLSVPPPDKQNSDEKKRYRHAQRLMAELEIISLLQFNIIHRPLRYGDINGLLTVILDACSRRLEGKGISIESSLPERCICMAAEPRLISFALISLLRAYADNNKNDRISVHAVQHKHSLSISLGGEPPFLNPGTRGLVRAAAQLHKGGVVVSNGRVAFSLRTGIQGAVGLFAFPSADDLLSNPLSAVNVLLE
ncbi:MAG: hypothetical protein PHR18_03445 [Oscillospiraceae bacterium]|nr:hypothetical protein [Oscillospiraceae bacterium]